MHFEATHTALYSVYACQGPFKASLYKWGLTQSANRLPRLNMLHMFFCVCLDTSIYLWWWIF